MIGGKQGLLLLFFFVAHFLEVKWRCMESRNPQDSSVSYRWKGGDVQKVPRWLQLSSEKKPWLFAVIMLPKYGCFQK